MEKSEFYRRARAEVSREIGCDPGEIRALRAKGVI